MDKRELNEAFSSLHASDALVQEVLDMKYEKKNPMPVRTIVRRAAVCAAVLAVLLTAVFWPATPGEDTKKTLGLSIQVYADGEFVDLQESDDDAIFAGDDNESPYPPVPKDRNVYVYNETTGEWELLHKKPEDKPPEFTLVVLTNEYLEYEPQIYVYIDGEEMDIFAKDNPNFRRYLGGFRDGRSGTSLVFNFEKVTMVEVVVTDKNDGTLLLRQVIEVTPAIYEVTNQLGEEDGVVENEGYMLVVKEKYAIEIE